MKALSSSTLKNVVSGSIVATLLAVTTGCVTTPGGYSVYDDIYEDVYKDNKEHKNTKTSIKKRIKTSTQLLSSVELPTKLAAWDTVSKVLNIKGRP
ncbi:hypothetical protein PKHYL_02530 [Psychrobacter sp. KH172YL61]|uniref:hypothetical protein n=1 Tax=Psychrobacter sp. KH172YL61 TaxID=2517899 RepID=UPI0010B00A15|nr:hypothetical protein [Psychrobacter sp. KH172YL61]BBI66062.1 hypothetical protein PKHYL_02530 [Psychrobacter sp. KH172YL61]